MTLEGRSVGHQGIGGPIQTHRSHRREVHPQQFTERASFAQPTPGRTLRPGACHARDNRTDGRGLHRRPDAQFVEHGAQPKLLHRPQRDVLHPDRARANQFERIHIDRLDVTARARRRDGGADALTSEELGGEVLGARLERRRATGRQGQLAGEKLLDTTTKHRPVRLRNLEMASQIEQRALAHLGAGAFGAHQAMSEVGLRASAGTGTPDEHTGTIPKGGE